MGIIRSKFASSEPVRVKPNERNFMSLNSTSQLILRRRVEETAFLYETECSRNYAAEISRLTTHKITLV
jgi:hypothetical protein